MGTIHNNRIWTGAAIDGKKVNGIAKNGAVIFRRGAINITNMIANGSFETNTTGWTGSGTLSRISIPTPGHDEFGSWCGQNSHSVNGAHTVTLSSAITVVSGRKYYIRNQVRYSTNGYGNIVQYYNSGTAMANGITPFTMEAANTWYLYDGIWTANSNSLQLRLNFSNGNGNQQRTAQFDNIVMIDLTSTFGAGNEPDITQCRDILSSLNGYWDGIGQY